MSVRCWHVVAFLTGALVVLVSGYAWAGEPDMASTTIPISTGAGGLGLGGGLAYWLLHGRLKTAESALASLAPQLPALVHELRSAVDDFRASISAQREVEVAIRGKIHDVRTNQQRYEIRLTKVEERVNVLIRQTGAPLSEITGDHTPVRDG